MRTPKFWAHRGRLALLLSPIGLITIKLTARRVRISGLAPGVPVICVGNAVVGGAGKTILTLDLLSRLPGRPFALTRGYKGDFAGPVRVEKIHTAREVGDEALLLAAAAPTIVARDRAAGAKLAVAQGATTIVMDDGLQNPTVQKTLSLMVIDGGYGFGNSLALPAGPLREPVAAASLRCQAAVLIGSDQTDALSVLPQDLPVLRAALAASCDTALSGKSVVAFAGIGRPEKFFESVRSLNASIEAAVPFEDHHAYTEADTRRLSELAAAHRAILLTTTKDFVKLPAAFKSKVTVLRVRLIWENEAALQKHLAAIV